MLYIYVDRCVVFFLHPGLRSDRGWSIDDVCGINNCSYDVFDVVKCVISQLQMQIIRIS